MVKALIGGLVGGVIGAIVAALSRSSSSVANMVPAGRSRHWHRITPC